jgi:hypothetical protein
MLPTICVIEGNANKSMMPNAKANLTSLSVQIVSFCWECNLIKKEISLMGFF